MKNKKLPLWIRDGLATIEKEKQKREKQTKHNQQQDQEESDVFSNSNENSNDSSIDSGSVQQQETKHQNGSSIIKQENEPQILSVETHDDLKQGENLYQDLTDEEKDEIIVSGTFNISRAKETSIYLLLF